MNTQFNPLAPQALATPLQSLQRPSPTQASQPTSFTPAADPTPNDQLNAQVSAQGSALPSISLSDDPPAWSAAQQAAIVRGFEAGLKQHGVTPAELTAILRQTGISQLEITAANIQNPAYADEIKNIQTQLDSRLNHPDLRALGQGNPVGQDGQLGAGTVKGIVALGQSQRGEPIELEITPIKQQTRTGCYRVSEAMLYNVIHGKDGQRDAYGEFDTRDRIRDEDMDYNSITVTQSENGSGRITVNPARAKIALETIDAELEAGRPVIAGVSYRKQQGREYNEGITDHFGVISGRGQDEAGTFYTFQDPAQGGTHKLRLDPLTGRLSGRGDMAGIYDVTLIRNATAVDNETVEHYKNMGQVLFRQGERSPEIGWMQTQLTHMGYDTKGTSGAYGNGTGHAVGQFQSAHNLPVRGGQIDTKTLEAIESAFREHQQANPSQVMFKKDQSSPQLRPLQTTLTKLGFNTGGTQGQFGPRTEAAVRSFQAAHNLPVNGQIDNQTWLKLLELDPG